MDELTDLGLLIGRVSLLSVCSMRSKLSEAT